MAKIRQNINFHSFRTLVRVGLLVLGGMLWAETGLCYSANKVWFEFMEDGTYKVVVNYTVPEIKEFRESYVIFSNKRKAESFYWALVRGADFYPSQPYVLGFTKPKLNPDPW